MAKKKKLLYKDLKNWDIPPEALKELQRELKPKRAFLTKDVRDTIINHIIKLDICPDNSDYATDTLDHILRVGCPGLDNMTDDELIIELLEACPTD